MKHICLAPRHLLAALTLLLSLAPPRVAAQFPSNFTVTLGGAYNAEALAICADPILPHTFYAAYRSQMGSIIAILDGSSTFYTLEIPDKVLIFNIYKVGDELFFCGLKMLNGSLKTAGVVGHVTISPSGFGAPDVCELSGGINRVTRIVASKKPDGTFTVLALGTQDSNYTIYPTQLLVNTSYTPGDFRTTSSPIFTMNHDSQIVSPYREHFADILDCGAEWVFVGRATEPSTGEPCISIRVLDKSTLSGISGPGTLINTGNHNCGQIKATHVDGYKIAVAVDDIDNLEQVVYTYDYSANVVFSVQKIKRVEKGGILDLVYMKNIDMLIMARQYGTYAIPRSLAEIKPFAYTGYTTQETEPISISLCDKCAVSHTMGYAGNLLAVFDGMNVFFRDYALPVSSTACYIPYPLDVKVEKLPLIGAIPAMTSARVVMGNLIILTPSFRSYFPVCP